MDVVDIRPEEFYGMLGDCEELPTTSQPSPEAFLPFFRQAEAAGDELICILLSSSLSGTCQSALVARDIVEYEGIHIVDSRQASLGARLLIEHALQLAAEGKSAREIVDILEEEKKKVCIYLMVDTLMYLHKGGRLPAAGAAVGSALNLKPVLFVQDGQVQVSGLARGRKGAWEKLFRLLEKDGGMQEERGYYLGYTGDRHCLDDFEAHTAGRLSAGCRGVVAVGSVIGVHVGPGGNALACFLK